MTFRNDTVREHLSQDRSKDRPMTPFGNALGSPLARPGQTRASVAPRRGERTAERARRAGRAFSTLGPSIDPQSGKGSFMNP